MPFVSILALSGAGAFETAYLTAAKLAHVDVACPLSGGCASVLNSEYAQLFGIVPLSALGMLAYGSVAGLALYGLRSHGVPGSAAPDTQRAALRMSMLAGSLLLASCSAYLVYILLSRFPGELCPWCISSAALSFALAGLAASGLRRRELADAAAPGLGLASATFLALSASLGSPNLSLAGDISELAYKDPGVTATSEGRAVALAQRLRGEGARMYGAFWCSHCYEQKQSFGKEAMAAFPYVECFPEGWRKGVQMATACQAAGLEGFPTWVMPDGTKLVGEQTFNKLESALDDAAAAAAVAAQLQAVP